MSQRIRRPITATNRGKNTGTDRSVGAVGYEHDDSSKTGGRVSPQFL